MKRNLLIGLWRLNGLVLLNLLLLCCYSCKKEDTQASLQIVNNDGITFRNGRLIFKDLTTFIDHQKWIFENQGNPELIAEKNKAYGIKSMTEYYLDGIKLEEDDPEFSKYLSKYPNVFYIEQYDNSTLYLLPHSKILCYIANKDGIYQVGDQIYRIVKNYIYQTGESNIEMLFLPKDQISSKDVKVIPSTTRYEAKTDYGNRTENFYNDNRFRIVSSLRKYMNGPLLYYDICTNPQKRSLGVYFRASLNTKSANSDGYFNVINCPLCPPGSITPSSSEVTGLSYIAYAMLDPIYEIDMNNSSCRAYSRGRLIDGTTEYIYISWVNSLVNSPSAIVTHTNILNDPY